jgi:hypothetical protein
MMCAAVSFYGAWTGVWNRCWKKALYRGLMLWSATPYLPVILTVNACVAIENWFLSVQFVMELPVACCWVC